MKLTENQFDGLMLSSVVLVIAGFLIKVSDLFQAGHLGIFFLIIALLVALPGIVFAKMGLVEKNEE